MGLRKLHGTWGEVGSGRLGLQHQAALVFLVSPWLAIPGATSAGCSPRIFHTNLPPLANTQVSAGGVVRDPEVHREVIGRVVDACAAVGFACQGWIESPIKGATAGNTEFLAYFKRGGVVRQGSAGEETAAAEEVAV